MDFFPRGGGLIMNSRMLLYLTVVLLIFSVACKGYSGNDKKGIKMEINQNKIRHSTLAGTWYEKDASVLKDTVNEYMNEAKVSYGLGKIVAVIAPHAGHVYSGPVAGYAYKQLIGKKFDTVIIVAPNHADPKLDFTSVMTEGAYETPMGLVPIDTEIAKAIVSINMSDDIKESELGHLTGYNGRMEHSLEIQLPFLQAAIGDFKLVPIIMGDRDNGVQSCQNLGKAIAQAVKGKNVLLVASSDLSHFHDNATLKTLDADVKERIDSFDPEGLLRDLASGKCEACGGLPIAAVMMASRELGATNGKVLNMADSGDVTGDHSSAVGYLAAVLTESSDKGAELGSEEKVGVSLGLSGQEKEVLRNVVKQTLESVVKGGTVPKYNNHNGKLGEEWGAFVTLTIDGRLRGCIGNIVGVKPLINTVAEMTRAAALEDPRFSPVKPYELKDIDFEISVLTPIKQVKDINEIVVGRDGIIISRGGYRGLLLPQVATEYNWDRKTFLEQTCVKAGLPRDAWKDPNTIIEYFSAEVFK